MDPRLTNTTPCADWPNRQRLRRPRLVNVTDGLDVYEHWAYWALVPGNSGQGMGEGWRRLWICQQSETAIAIDGYPARAPADDQECAMRTGKECQHWIHGVESQDLFALRTESGRS